MCLRWVSFSETFLKRSNPLVSSHHQTIVWHPSRLTSPAVKHHTCVCLFGHISLTQHQFYLRCVHHFLSTLSSRLAHSFIRLQPFHRSPRKNCQLCFVPGCNINSASFFLLLDPVLCEGKHCLGLSVSRLTSLGTFCSYHSMVPVCQGYTSGTSCSGIVWYDQRPMKW